MANDRIWIRCKQCGAGFLLTKYLPSGDLAELHNGEKLLVWLGDHLWARQKYQWKLGTDLEAEPGFEIVTDDPQTATGQMYVAGEPFWDYDFEKMTE